MWVSWETRDRENGGAAASNRHDRSHYYWTVWRHNFSSAKCHLIPSCSQILFTIWNFPGHETRYFTLQNKWVEGWGDLHIIVARYVGQLGDGGGILLSSSYLAVAVGGSRRGKPVSGVRDVDGGTSSCTEDVLEVGPRPRPRSWLPSLRTGHMAPGSWSSTMVGELGSRSFVSTIVLTPSSLSVWILVWIRALGSMTFADRHYCCNL